MSWGLAALGALAAVPCRAQAMRVPTQPSRIIVPFPPGGSADAAARAVAGRLSEEWGQPVIVESKVGAGTTIASSMVAAAPGDGATLYLTGVISHATAAAMYRKLNYDPLRSFVAVGRVAQSPFVLVVRPDGKYNSVADLVSQARAHPRAITYASSGIGAAPHLATALFACATGIDVLHVPYKGTGPALIALLSGEVEFFIADVAALPQVRAGKLRALAVTTAQRSPLLPEVPSLRESGVALDVPSVTGLLAPASMPRELVAGINASLQKVLAMPETRQVLTLQGFEPAPSSPDAFAQIVSTEVQRYAKVVKDAGIQPE